MHDTMLEASGCEVRLGELMNIISSNQSNNIMAEVVGLRDNNILLMPFKSPKGLCLNSTVVPLGKALALPASEKLLGRVLDPLCRPLDGFGEIAVQEHIDTHISVRNPLDRVPIDQHFKSGVKAIDVFTTLGKGQRMGIMSGSGVGKSTLLGMMAAQSNADVVVIGFIGERGREVNEFIQDTLGPEGLKKSVVVVATSDQSAVMRRQAAFSATAIASWFRAQNKNVLLIMDSITRFAMAQREIGLATGEPVGSRGYPSSVFAMLPALVEGGGRLKDQGSVTSIYTVLVEGDDINDPISDHMRSLLDGHIVLSREMASRGHFPAIDIPNSVSRLSNRLLTDNQIKCVTKLRKSISVYSSAQDMIEIGAYEKGNNAELDQAIQLKGDLDRFVTQNITFNYSSDECWKDAQALSEKVDVQVRDDTSER